MTILRAMPLCVALAVLSGCGNDWREKAMHDAQIIVQQQLKAETLTFSRVQFVGDNSTGQTCGYVERPDPDGGVRRSRFIVFIDGAGGKNPYLSDVSAPYPANKADFAINWQTQCLDLGYRE